MTPDTLLAAAVEVLKPALGTLLAALVSRWMGRRRAARGGSLN